jgi:hypothetical protein
LKHAYIDFFILNQFILFFTWIIKCENLNYDCRNPSLKLASKARACKVAGQEGSPGVTSHAPGSARVWGNEPSHPQMNSHFGSWSPNGFSNLQRAIAGIKTHWFEEFFISMKSYWNVDVWNGLAWPIWTYETQVMCKERLGIKLPIWFPTTKSRELTWFRCVQVACNIMLKRSW